MPGTKAGAAKGKVTILQRHGEDYYSKIGAIGGAVNRPNTRPFAANPQLASKAGRIGGSRRGSHATNTQKVARTQRRQPKVRSHEETR